MNPAEVGLVKDAVQSGSTPCHGGVNGAVKPGVEAYLQRPIAFQVRSLIFQFSGHHALNDVER